MLRPFFFPQFFAIFSHRFFYVKKKHRSLPPTRKTTHHTRGVSHAEVAEVVEVAPVPEGPDTKALCHGVAKALRRAKRCTEAPIKSDLVYRGRGRPKKSPQKGRVEGNFSPQKRSQSVVLWVIFSHGPFGTIWSVFNGKYHPQRGTREHLPPFTGSSKNHQLK